MDDAIAVQAFRDNYIWLIPGPKPGVVAIVDPGEAEPVVTALARHKLSPALILCTHHHGDHTAGIQALASRFSIPVYGPAIERIPGVTHPVEDGDVIRSDWGVPYTVLAVPGHTRGHVAYFGDGRVFCGDTLFVAGCGRLFEGTAFQLHASLMRLAGLPPTTRVYCGHEYTSANLVFARTVEPDNEDILVFERRSRRLLQAGQPTIPSTIDDEKRINPFLRTAIPAVRAAAARWDGQQLASDVAVFAALRRWKDDFKG
ncbi:MAG TPA: hydroxyacylglutathione hydrolase [Acidiferrobacter sp.]|nr:hydroxyacylglutathione hydrolase [Acidiferrobacter sp.]